MDKTGYADAFGNSGVKPHSREKLGPFDLLFADGFSQPPHLSMQRFGIEPNEFPAGMYVTLWLIAAGEKPVFGQPMFFNISETNQTARINAARKEAKKAYRADSLQKLLKRARQ